MKYKVMIVDDEKDTQSLIEMLLIEMFPQVSVVKKACSVTEARSYLVKNKVDLMFLDVQLGSENGFSLLDKTHHSWLPPIIFITAYDQYAIKAVKVSAEDYILKPINEEEFQVAVQNVLNKKDQVKLTAKQDNLRIAVPSLTGLDFIDIEDIVRCEADSNYTLIYLKDNSKKMVSRSLITLEKELLNHSFLRVHHKHVVNLKLVKSYTKGTGGGFVSMFNGQAVPVSTRRKQNLFAAFSPS